MIDTYFLMSFCIYQNNELNKYTFKTISFYNSINKLHRKIFCANLATQTLCIVAICVFNYANNKLLQVQTVAAVGLVGVFW